MEDVVSESVIHGHEEAAEGLLAGSAVLAVVVLAGLVPGVLGKGARYAAVPVALVVVVLGFRVGKSGGELVYTHGAAAAYVQGDGSGSSGTSNAPRRGDDDDDDRTPTIGQPPRAVSAPRNPRRRFPCASTGKAFCSALLAALVLLPLVPNQASAIPAFARKYKTTCALCHAPFPRLNAFGAMFAANGFQMAPGRGAHGHAEHRRPAPAASAGHPAGGEGRGVHEQPLRRRRHRGGSEDALGHQAAQRRTDHR